MSRISGQSEKSEKGKEGNQKKQVNNVKLSPVPAPDKRRNQEVGKKEKEQSNNKKKNKNQSAAAIVPPAAGKKKKNNPNPVKPVESKNAIKNKEKKENKSKGNKKAARVADAKPSVSLFRKLVQTMFYAFVFVTAVLGYLYIVDIERYRLMRDRGVSALNSTMSLLPAEVVTKGQQAIEYIRPTVEVAVVKLQVLVNQTSTALKTNPVLKDHWTNINEISAIIGERLAEYMRTVYKQIPIYYDTAKNKLF